MRIERELGGLYTYTHPPFRKMGGIISYKDQLKNMRQPVFLFELFVWMCVFKLRFKVSLSIPFTVSHPPIFSLLYSFFFWLGVLAFHFRLIYNKIKFKKKIREGERMTAVPSMYPPLFIFKHVIISAGGTSFFSYLVP